MTLIEQLKSYFNYNPETGEVTWAKSPGRGCPIGKRAGCLRYDGYLIVRFQKTNYYLHRVIWAITHDEWPKELIDHIDKNRQNNKLSNLRQATKKENQRNRTSATNTSSQYLGVCYHIRNKKWQAQGIGPDGKNVYLGQFETEVEAADAYDNYALITYGDYASINLKVAA